MVMLKICNQSYCHKLAALFAYSAIAGVFYKLKVFLFIQTRLVIIYHTLKS